jgi:hypothetical protein
VGESRDVAGRLENHVEMLEKYAEDEEAIDEGKFAGRAVRLGLTTARLQVCYVVWTSNPPPQSVIKAIQDLLNRWHRPILGRL